MSNLIDRQAAIDALDKYSVWVMYTQGDSQKDEVEFVESIIKQTKKAIQSMLIEDLPSVQPEPIKYNTEDFDWERIKKEWRNAPVAVLPAQPEPKRGKWIPQDMNKSYGMISTAVYSYPKCSVCGQSANYTNFCPNCGADMRGEQDG